MSRPPPPGQSDAVAGYREVGFFLPSPAAYAVAAEGSEPDAGAHRGRQTREFSFGTIKRTVANKTPSPPPSSLPDAGPDEAIGDSAAAEVQNAGQEGEQASDKSFPVFSIGLTPGEAGPSRIRSKTHPKSASVTHERGNTAPAKLGPSHSQDSQEITEDVAPVTEGAANLPVTKVIDLTDSVTPTWEFGSTKQGGEEDVKTTEFAPPGTSLPDAHSNGMEPVHVHPDTQAPPGPNVLPPDSTSLPSIPRPPQYAPRMQVPHLTMGMPNGMPQPPSHSPYPSSSITTVSPSADHRPGDDWEVKNYGWGFGRGNNGAGLAPNAGRVDRDREYSPREYNPGRPRRGSYGGHGFDRGGGHERGGYSGRRARGINGGYGGRGYGGRNNSRGGYQQGQPTRPPFTVTQQPVGGPSEQGYYAPPPPQGTTYFHPLPYDYGTYPYMQVPMTTAPTPTQSAPPVPIPQSMLSFPLDPTRYHLLGQLEYYLSAQNLAQDFYLRQRVSRYWFTICSQR